MANEFVIKNGLISQGNITATGSLVVSQNITASNISASSFTGSVFGTSSWSTNSLTASSLITASSYAINNLTASNISCSGYLQSAAAAYQQITSSTFDSASYSNQWVRIAKFDYNLPGTIPIGGYFNEFALKITANPAAGMSNYNDRFVSPSVPITGSNKGNYANLLITNASYGPLPAINVLNAWSYNTPLVTKIRSAKDSGNATWYVDVFVTNQSASAVDLMRVEIDSGRGQLQWQLNPSTASYTSSVEFDITTPGVKNANTYVYNFDGNVTSSGNILVGGRIGVGTTNPSNPFGVNGAASFGSYASTTAPANGIIVSGNVGIGTSTVVNKLDVVGNISCSSITGALYVSTQNITSSWATNAITASYVSSSNIVGTVTSASYAVSSSLATTASYIAPNLSGVLTLTGTANQVLVNGGVGPLSGSVTLTLPQSINTTSAPSFYGLTVTSSSLSSSSNVLLLINPDSVSSTNQSVHALFRTYDVTQGRIGSKRYSNSFVGNLDLEVLASNTTATYPSSSEYVTGIQIIKTAAGAGTLYVNLVPTTGNVGIGITSSVNKLDVAGNISCSVITASLFFGTSSWSNNALTAALATSINFTASNATTSQTASYLTPANSYSITNLTASNISGSGTGSFGMVGVGTTNPNNKLEVAGSSGTAIISVNNTSLNRSSSFGIDNTGAYLQNSTNGDYFDFRNATGTANIRILHNSNTYLNTTYTSVGSLVSSGSKLSVFGNLSVGSTYGSTASPTDGAIFEGNVGIGTTNPTNKLNVVGNISCSVITASNFFGTSSWASNALTTSNVNGGTNTYLARWTGNTSLSTGLISDNGTDLGIGIAPDASFGVYHIRTSPETVNETAGYWLSLTNPRTGSVVSQTFRAHSTYNAPTASSITGICSDFLSYTQVNSSGSLYGKIWQFYAGGFVLTGSVTDKTSFYAANAAIGAGATVTTEHGLYVSGLTAGTTIYGIRSIVAASATRWNLYIDGTAKNYIAGNVGIGTSTSVNKLDVVGNISCSAITASLFSGSLSGSVFGTSSWATNALTAAFLPVGTYSITSSWATNSLTASSLVIANNYQVATLSINTSSVLLPLTVHGTTYSASISGQAANSIFRIGGAGTNAILDMGVNADVAPGFSWLQARSKIDYSSFSNLSLNSVGGNVGVGTTTPTAILEVSSSTATTVFNVKGAGGANLFTVSGSGNIGVGTTPSTTYKMQINGGFSATTKSFDIEHPTKLGKRLVYGSLESPYHGVRLTGKGKLVKGKGIIQLPDYMKSLVDYETANVQITNIKHNKVIYVDDIDEKNNIINVAAKIQKTQLNKELEFYWTFTAIRKDVPNLQVEL